MQWLTTQEHKVLQWGRDPRIAETLGRPHQCPNPKWLQWGRDPRIAETWRVARRRVVRRRFNGAAICQGRLKIPHFAGRKFPTPRQVVVDANQHLLQHG